ncbi:molybdate ABC transporter substrate-binding protein [Pseudolabrys sp. FHR47]|uniref:molybdate ABC transporter substrate-binding protein n=1 Tax=Pseudolabrys sp. FHR47 TaxID=2562284 RepID=UPI0010BF297A|nr:molybdate ABC transporter substrate-binding protein [Pseudolabrys sp. FHR47]
MFEFRRRALLRSAVIVGIAVATSSLPIEALSQQSSPPIVFAAASLKTALDAIAADWRKDTGKAIAISYASSSALARQVEQGAPADVFFSADLDWMDWLQQRNLIKTNTRETLLGNTLVLIAPADAAVSFKIAPGADLGAALGGSRLAVTEVKSTPAGKYTKSALEKLGMWAGVEKELAQADTVRAALAFVARGEARFGVVYATDAKAEPKVRVVDVFPTSSHEPIAYPVALTASSINPDALAFLAYLKTRDAGKRFVEQGFSILGQ